MKKSKIMINMTELLINSSGKMNRTMDIVKTGCGYHIPKDKKKKYKDKWKKEVKEFYF